LFLALDVGTSKLKGGIFSAQGELLASAQAPLSLLVQSRPGAEYSTQSGAVRLLTGFEVDPAQWLTALKQVCRQLTLSRFPGQISVIVSGNGPTVLPLAADGKPLYPAITWLDTRGQVEAAGLLAQKGIAFKQASFFLAKAYWLKEHQPALYAQTKYFMSCPEYIIYHLCGMAYTILPAPAYSGYYWTREALLALELDPAKFPPFIRPGQLIGNLREEAARELGIQWSTGKNKPTLVAGGPDFLVALLGTGTIKPGLTCDRAGTSEGINHCTGKPVDSTTLLSLPHLIDGLYNVSGSISTSGKAFDWFREVSGYNQYSYEQFFEEIAAVQPGARKLLFLPHLAGERAPLWAPRARGAFVGLALHHTRQEMGRAVAESLGYAIRYIISCLAAQGLQVTELRLAGEQARSRQFNQLKADIIGLPLLRPASLEAELVGDACLGLVANGIYPDIETAVTRCVKISAVIEPRLQMQALYTEMAALYAESYQALKTIFDRLSS
jgi:xylulokinase